MPTICVIRSLKGAGKDPVQIKSRDTRPRNMAALKRHLQSYDWQTFLSTPDVNSTMAKLHETIQLEIDLCIPEVTRTLKRKQLRREPWITASLKQSIDKSKSLYHKTLKNRENEVLREHYLAYKRTLKKALVAAKRGFHQDKCLEFQRNTKKLWQLINKVSGKMNDKTSSIDYLSVNGIKEYTGEQIANTLARYFANVGETFANKVPKSSQSISNYLELLQKNSESLFFAPSSTEEIRKIIASLPAKRSCGSDNISNVLLKEIAPILCEPLSIITNQSMHTGIFPDLMKLAEVVPLYKSKSRENETNYRPISLLITMSKVMEKVVYERVYQFLVKTGQICDTQYGFCPKHSCEHAIEPKLELFGVRGVCLNWFRSYLEN